MTTPYDFLIVGAGLFGSIVAYKAKEAGLRVLVLESRNHLGGNCFSQKQEGIHVHVYGPHIFHTSNKQVWEFMNRFTSFLPYHHHVKAKAQGKLWSFPINLSTFYEIWGIETPQEAIAKLQQECIVCPNPKNLKEWALSQVGPTLYKLFIEGYTQKQWQEDPQNLPAFIIKRLPIRLEFNDSYFNDPYVGIPANGYTFIFEKLLEGIEVRLGVDYLQHRALFDTKARKIVYSGHLDALFGYDEGELTYRTQTFDHEWHPSRNVQGIAVINYCDREVPYTRTIEHRHFDSTCNSEMSLITKETPASWSRDKVPYYPVNTPSLQELYGRYKVRAEKNSQLLLGGRLAEYKYYDMHHVVASALAKAQLWIHQLKHSL
jgi:UDP-galactopyranose mutase